MIKSEPKSDTTIFEVLELRPEEMNLIKSIRNSWRFGEITILVREGVPYRIRRVTEFLDLQDK